ncbi:hypothetical protein HYFRA_00003148 [Hymenoscyphus fraxineus]|uniref:NYN domain-containing protein n=1 Tax=Hymenoscyphus fraxineus TaxID=746836 RepID=A0A9N9PLB6_9HELO|nr:hypothetical protein HYFRA_00003148 [Hymenoscyphus fraxineus]
MDPNARHPEPELGNLDVVLRFLHNYPHLHTPTSSTDAEIAVADVAIDPTNYDPTTSKPKSLGDFNRCWEFLGRPLDAVTRRRHESFGTSSSSPTFSTITPSRLSPVSTPLSSAPEDETEKIAPTSAIARVSLEGENEDKLKAKEVRWQDESLGLVTSQSRRRTKRISNKPSSQQESDTEIRYTLRSGKKIKVINDEITKPQSFEITPHKTKGLIPSSLVPPPPPFLPYPPAYPDGSIIRPKLTLTYMEKKARLIKKLKKRNLISRELSTTSLLPEYKRKIQSDGIHIFVDFSNINIGFFQQIKRDRGIPLQVYRRFPPLSFHCLSLLFERNRPVARRVLAGSINGGSLTHDGLGRLVKQRLPQVFLDAQECGYELNILEPVVKAPSLTPKRRGGKGNGYATSGHSSGSDAPSYVRVSKQEQCVDEILQMKMLESIVDTEEPSTMVLASGDAAEAEYSGGFLKTVERALMKGWQVEVYAWSGGLSSEYCSKEFLQRWKGKFTVIVLDDFAEELLAFYVTSCLVGDQTLGLVDMY